MQFNNIIYFFNLPGLIVSESETNYDYIFLNYNPTFNNTVNFFI